MPTRRRTPPGEAGFALIEVLVSALVLAIVSVGVLSLLQATTRSAAAQRQYSTAYALAQEVQARLRSMRITALNGLNQTLPVTLDGTEFQVQSTGVFVNNKTSIASCTGENISADYVQITSKVTWTGMGKRLPVVVQSIVSPSSGSIDTSHGTLSISAVNAMQKPLSGVKVEGKGPGTFSGETDENGCVTFADLPEGTYTLTPIAAGFVDRFGNPPSKIEAGVIPNGAQPVGLEYDHPGNLEVKFKYRVGSSTEFKASNANSIMVYHPVSMKTPTVFSTPGKALQPIVKVEGLFPSKESYAAYAGSCTSNNPNPKSEKEAPGAAAAVGVLVPPSAGPNPIPEIQLPALNLVVKSGSSTVVGAKVKITGTCSFERIYTTVAGGELPDPGLPWGTYEVCASAKILEGKTEVQRRMKTKTAQTVQNLVSGTPLTLDISGSGSEKATC